MEGIDCLYIVIIYINLSLLLPEPSLPLLELTYDSQEIYFPEGREVDVCEEKL